MCNNNVPELRERVIHVTSDEKSINWEWEKNSEQVDRQIQFVSIDDIPSIRSNTNVVLPSEIQEGDILIKHPFEPDTYLNVVDAKDEIRKDKWFKISEIAQCLGATGFTIEEAKESIESRTLDATLGIKYKTVRSKSDLKKEETLKEKLGITISDKFGGCRKITDNSYLEAKELAIKYHLDNDSAIRSLIRMRNPSKENMLTNRSIHCEMTKELNSALDAAFSLNVMPNVFSLDANVKKTLETKETITLDVRFEFPDN
jgi:hypothetical protein